MCILENKGPRAACVLVVKSRLESRIPDSYAIHTVAHTLSSQAIVCPHVLHRFHWHQAINPKTFMLTFNQKS